MKTKQAKLPLSLNIQYFAASFNPDNVLMSDAINGKVPTEYATGILEQTVQGSAVMQLAQNEPMTKPEKEITYLADGPGAYWVGEAEKIQTSKATWVSAKIVAKKVAVIIPVSKEFLNYSVSNFFDMMKSKIAEAFYTKFDQAALFGTNSPYAAGHSVLAAATEAGNTVAFDESKPLYGQLNSLLGLIEDEEYDPNGLATAKSLRSMLRGEVDSAGRPIFNEVTGNATNQVLGQPIAYINKKSYDKTKALVMAADWDYARFGILQDIEYAVSQDATLTTVVGEDGKPINLFERDMFALRATMHVGFMILKDEAFSVLTPDVTP